MRTRKPLRRSSRNRARFGWTRIGAVFIASTALILITTETVLSCGGSRPKPVWSRSTALVKAVPVVFPVAGAIAPTPAVIPVAVILASAAAFVPNPPGPGCTPVTTTVTLTLVCVPPPPAVPTPVGMAVFPTPTTGVFFPLLVPIAIPAGPPRVCLLAGTAVTLWADGSTTTGVGDIEICIVDPAPGQLPDVASDPRLDLQLLTPDIQSAHPGDQMISRYRLTNNDPVESVTITLDVDSEQTARMPGASPEPAGSGSGPIALSDPGGGDNFPIQFVEDLFPPAVIFEYVIDDGSQDTSTSSAGSTIWINQFVVSSGDRVIDSISVAYGTVAAGEPVSVLLYSDPNNDGNPSDAVLERVVDTTTANGDTGIFNPVIIEPFDVGPDGTSFFVGVLAQDTSASTPAAADTTTNQGQSWLAGDGVCTANIEDLSANAAPPAPFAGNFMVRASGRSALPIAGWVTLPPDPVNFGVPIISRTITLCPGESREVGIATRSWPMCRTGSACEQRARVSGFFSDGSPALACAATAVIADTAIAPEFLCPDGGTHCEVSIPGPDALEYQGLMPSHFVAQLARLVGSQVVPVKGPPLLFQEPQSVVTDAPNLGKLSAIHAGPLFVDQFFDVEFQIELDTLIPELNSQVVDLHLEEASPLVDPNYFFGVAHAQLTGGPIPPSLDTGFDLFFHVTVDGFSGSLFHEAQILPGSAQGLIIGPNLIQLSMTCVFQQDPSLPDQIDAVAVNLDASGIAVGLVPPAPPDPCPFDCGFPDGIVNILDLLLLLSEWGGPGDCDLDGNGTVGIVDLLGLLANWGPCP